MSTARSRLPRKRKRPEPVDETLAIISAQTPGPTADSRPEKRIKIEPDTNPTHAPMVPKYPSPGAKNLPKKHARVAKGTSRSKEQHRVDKSDIQMSQEANPMVPTLPVNPPVAPNKGAISLVAPGVSDGNVTTLKPPTGSEIKTSIASMTVAKPLLKKPPKATKKSPDGLHQHGSDQVTLPAISSSTTPMKPSKANKKSADGLHQHRSEQVNLPASSSSAVLMKPPKTTKKTVNGLHQHGSEQVTLPAISPSARLPLVRPDPGFTDILPDGHEVKPVVTKLITGKLQWPSHPVPIPPQDDGPCPIDWAQAPYDLVESAYPVWKDAYLWRQPWTKNPPSFVECGGMYMKKNNKTGAPKDYEETVRKQFMKMNILVFLQTGRYYAGSTSGLKNLVPEADEALKQKRKEEKKVAKEAYGGEGNHEGGSADEDDKHFKTIWEKLLSYVCEETAFCSTRNADVEHASALLRFVPIDLIRDKSAILESQIDQGSRHFEVNYDVDIIDGFINCFWPFDQKVLPNTINSPVKHGGVRAWQVSSIVWTAGKTIQLYCLAHQLGCSDICDMAVTQLYHMYKLEITYRYEFFTGARNFSDVPSGFASALDFEPEDVNKLWKLPDEDDQMRALWLDIIRAKAYKGIAKLEEDFEAYNAEVLEAVESKYLPHTTLADLRKRVATAHGDTLEVPDPRLAHGDVPPGVRKGVARSYSALCGLNKLDFCNRYHKHTRLDLPCHIGKPAPTLPEDNDQLPEKPNNRIKMTINGIKGFTIMNHSSFSDEYFQQLPAIETEWDWKRIRSVNTYDTFDQRYMGRRGRPSYFASHEMDNMGRFPSHPGYDNRKSGGVKPKSTTLPTAESESLAEAQADNVDERIQNPGTHKTRGLYDGGYHTTLRPMIKAQGKMNFEAGRRMDRIKVGRVQKKKQADRARPNINRLTDRREIRKDRDYTDLGDQPSSRQDYDGDVEMYTDDDSSIDTDTDIDARRHRHSEDVLLYGV